MNKLIHTCLITGLPGSGKTLLAVEMLLENSKSENPRIVFTNIKGLDYKKLNCFPLDDPKLITLVNYPPGSVFVIDECQEHYPTRSAGTKKPDEIALFETRRHSGYDFILLTQHPKLIDKNVRVLISDHYHCIRPFNVSYRNVLHWPTVNEDPEPNQSHTTAVTEKKSFDKELYGLYKSSTVHTMKPRVPLKPFLTLAACFLLIGSCVYFTVNRLLPDDLPKQVVSDVEVIDKTETATKASESEPPPVALYVGHVQVKNTFGVSFDVLIEFDGVTYFLSDLSNYRFSPGEIVVWLAGKQHTVSIPADIQI